MAAPAPRDDYDFEHAPAGDAFVRLALEIEIAAQRAYTGLISRIRLFINECFVWRAESAPPRCPSRLAQQRVEISVLIVARAGERRQELRAAPRHLGGKGEHCRARIVEPTGAKGFH